MKTFTFKGFRGREAIVLLNDIVGILEGKEDDNVGSYIRLRGQQMLEDCAEKYIDVKKRWEQALAH